MIIKMPTTETKWQAVANDFNSKWQFPNCLGAMDGKHIVLKKPINSGSTFYNYKHTCSIVLLAVVDANYRFLYVDVGCQGRISDGGVFRNSSLYAAIASNDIKIPVAQQLPESDTVSPFVFVADDAFPLMNNIMKPYAQRGLTQKQRIFNYRLSRARRISENAFGIMVARFRVFRSAMEIQPDKARNVVLAAIVLHNFLQLKNTAANVAAREGTEDLGQFRPITSHQTNSGDIAKDVRNNLADYFMGKGQVTWQWSIT